MFAYQTAAYRRGKDIDSLVTFGSPVDTRAPLPIPLSPEVAPRLATGLIDSGLLRKVALPGWASRLGFKLLTPAKSVQGRVQFLLALHDRDALLPRERQRRFLESEGWTAWSGPAIADILEQFLAHNRMLEGGFVIDDRLVTLADIELPDPDVGRLHRHDRPPRFGARHPPCRAARRGLRDDAAGRALRPRRRLDARSTTPGRPSASGSRWRAARRRLPDTIVPAEQVQPSRRCARAAAPRRSPRPPSSASARPGSCRHGPQARARGARPGQRGAGAAAPPGPDRAARPVHPDQPRPAARRAGPQVARRDLLPVRRPRASGSTRSSTASTASSRA